MEGVELLRGRRESKGRPLRSQDQLRTTHKGSKCNPRLPTEGLTTPHPSSSRQDGRKNTLTKEAASQHGDRLLNDCTT